MLCVVLLLASAFHAGLGHADHVGGHGPAQEHAAESHGLHAQALGTLDLACATTPGETDVSLDACAISPGCALGALDVTHADFDPRFDAASHPFGARHPIGVNGHLDPHPPRDVQV